MPLTLVTVVTTGPCYVALDISIRRYVAGDDAIIQVEKKIDALNWDVVGYITVTNGNVIDVVGTPYFVAAAFAAATVGGYCFHLYSDIAEQFRVTVTQGVGPLKQVDYLYNILQKVL